MDQEERAKGGPENPPVPPQGREEDATERQRTGAAQSRNYQQRLNDLYRSDQFREQAIGFWAKFTYEFAVKSVPIALGVGAGVCCQWLGLISYGYLDILSWGAGISVSITFVGWCMSEGNRSERSGTGDRAEPSDGSA